MSFHNVYNEIYTNFHKKKFIKDKIENHLLESVFTQDEKCVLKGVLCELNKQHKEAFDCFTKSAELNNSFGLFCLGQCHFTGYGVEKNYEKAIEYFVKSANLNNAWGYCGLGNCYYLGFGCNQSYNDAFNNYNKANEIGNCSFGTYGLGLCYNFGYGSVEDFTKAFECFEKSAKDGNINSLLSLGLCYFNGKGVKKNRSLALECFIQSKTYKFLKNKILECYRNLTKEQKIEFVLEFGHLKKTQNLIKDKREFAFLNKIYELHNLALENKKEIDRLTLRLYEPPNNDLPDGGPEYRKTQKDFEELLSGI